MNLDDLIMSEEAIRRIYEAGLARYLAHLAEYEQIRLLHLHRFTPEKGMLFINFIERVANFLRNTELAFTDEQISVLKIVVIQQVSVDQNMFPYDENGELMTLRHFQEKILYQLHRGSALRKMQEIELQRQISDLAWQRSAVIIGGFMTIGAVCLGAFYYLS